MKISDDHKKIIVTEINYVVDKMKKTSNGEEMLYYFTAVYSVISRIFNLEYDRDLICAHFILQHTSEALNGRLQAIVKGGETLIPLNEDHFKKLIDFTIELGKKIDKNEDITETLKKFILLAFTTTGNGHYLQEKGLLKI